VFESRIAALGLTAAVALSILVVPDDVRASTGSALRQAFADLWNRLSTLWKAVVVLATLGSAVALALLFVALFQAEPERALRVGDTAAWQGLDFRFRKIACHKRRKDLPKWEAERGPYPFLVKGELCFVYFQIRNSSDESRNTYALLPTRTGSGPSYRLRVRGKEYEATTAGPMLPGTLVPDQEESQTFIFDIPRRVEPTALTLKDGQGDDVEWEIR
jgi:hypothetical protein